MNKIRVFKITKYARGCVDVLYFIWDKDWNLKKEHEEDYMVGVCDKHPSGHSYGYDFEWEEVFDIPTITTVLTNEINNIQNKIDALTSKVSKFKDFLIFEMNAE